MQRKTTVIIAVVIALTAFLTWRFLRPMNIFIVGEAFERPIPVKELPTAVEGQTAKACGRCHTEIYSEWTTTIHSQAWTDPYFQTDWKFDGSQYICKNCHIPLQDQQEHLVMGFRDKEKWDPILKPNPHFDAALQREGVTCGACHLREDKILGPNARTTRRTQSKKWIIPIRSAFAAMSCRATDGTRSSGFLPAAPWPRSRPGRGRWPSRSGEVTETNLASLGCVECHMPAVTRALVPGGPPRAARRHLWRGGHDPEMVRQGLDVHFTRLAGPAGKETTFVLRLRMSAPAITCRPARPIVFYPSRCGCWTKTAAALKEEQGVLRRTVMWRPFIVDLGIRGLRPMNHALSPWSIPRARYPGRRRSRRSCITTWWMRHAAGASIIGAPSPSSSRFIASACRLAVSKPRREPARSYYHRRRRRRARGRERRVTARTCRHPDRKGNEARWRLPALRLRSEQDADPRRQVPLGSPSASK